MADPRTFKDWYADNREGYNARRRERYQDPEFQERERKRLREYRASRDKAPSDGRKFCEIDGVRVEVFRLSQVCGLVGIRPQLVRALENQGLIPKPTAPFKNRYYTRGQIVAMAPLLLHCKENARRLRGSDVRADTEELSKYAHGEWNDVDDAEG